MAFDVAALGIDEVNLPTEWKLKRLDYLAILNPEQVNSAYPYSRILYLDIANVSTGSFGEPAELPLADAPSRAKRIVRESDTIFSTVRPGNRAYAFMKTAPANLIASTGFAVLRSRADSEPRFIYYLLTSDPIIAYLASIAEEKTAYPSVNPEDIAECTVPIPPLNEQRAIAHILGTLDDKIELNRRMSETLEAMARALFKSWFVDFDPVRAKMEGRWKKGESLPGLPADLWEVFPDRLVDSELGEIPEGWEVKVLDDLSSVMLGGDWGGNEPSPKHTERTRCIRGADIPDLQAGCMGKMPIRYLKPSSLEKRKLADGDLVVEISGGSPTQSTGRPVLVSERLLRRLDAPLVCSNFCRLLKPKKRVYSKFVFLWLRTLYSADEFFQFENGTTGIKNFAFSLFSSQYRLCMPPNEMLAAFDEQVSLAFSRHQSTAAEVDSLVALRDTLLPKLISGEIRVKDADKFVERAV